MTFAIVAFLIGGLTINANAQEKKVKKDVKVENTQSQTQAQAQKTVNYDKLLKDFEFNVNNYITTYEKALKDGTLDKSDYMTYLKKAQDLQTQLNNNKDKLNKEQTEYFKRVSKKLADALKRK